MLKKLPHRKIIWKLECLERAYRIIDRHGYDFDPGIWEYTHHPSYVKAARSLRAARNEDMGELNSLSENIGVSAPSQASDKDQISMTPEKAKTIIEALANGINPETGEIISEHSALDNPDVVRALFIAVRGLEQLTIKQKKQVALPPKAGKLWTDAEDKELLAEFDGGLTIKEIAEKHSRTRSAINSRLIRFGRIHYLGV